MREELPEYESGKLAYKLGFERDEFDADEHSSVDQREAWQRGWDAARAEITPIEGDKP